MNEKAQEFSLDSDYRKCKKEMTEFSDATFSFFSLDGLTSRAFSILFQASHTALL